MVLGTLSEIMTIAKIAEKSNLDEHKVQLAHDGETCTLRVFPFWMKTTTEYGIVIPSGETLSVKAYEKSGWLRGRYLTPEEAVEQNKDWIVEQITKERDDTIETIQA